MGDERVRGSRGRSIIERTGNNFDFIRWLAASCVIFSHEYAVVPGAPSEPLASLTSGFLTLGSVGVDVFFVVSGFLVTRSLIERNSLTFFAMARTLRIFQALAVVVAICALVLGPIATTLPLRAYFGQRETWTYVARNTLPIAPQWGLPGVFEGLPAAAVVNGPLWTLAPELAMYALLFLFGVASLAWPRGRRRIVGIGMAAALLAGLARHGDLQGHGLEPSTVYRLAPYFAAGALLQLAGERAWRAAWIPVVVWAAAAASRGTLLWVPGFTLALALSVVALAQRPLPWISRWGRYGDFSYGLYICAFPIQQSLVAAAPQLSLPAHFALAYPLALACAVLSWRFVEAPALARKSRFAPPRAPGAG